MPFANDLPQRQALLRLGPSVATELSWLVLRCGRKKSPVFNISGKLLEDAENFWGDGRGIDAELMVLASALGCLRGWDIAPLFLMGKHPLPHLPTPALETESAEDKQLISARLKRLTQEPATRTRYARLLAEIWQAAEPEWEAHGRPAVQRAVTRIQASLDHGADVLDLLPVDHVAKRDEFESYTRDALTRRDVLLTPTYFAGEFGHLLDLPDTLSIAVGIGVTSNMAARRKQAEEVASRMKLLSDATRVLLLAELREAPAAVGELAQRVGVAQPTASVHLRQLRDAGLLDAVKQGSTTRYVAKQDAITELMRVSDGILT
jgi:DNA-binding transcriptional ArsR family regulator